MCNKLVNCVYCCVISVIPAENIRWNRKVKPATANKLLRKENIPNTSLVISLSRLSPSGKFI